MSAFAVNDKTLPLVLTRRAKLIGLPRSITAPVIADFCRWYRCNGADWTVARTKNIKQLVLNRVAGRTQVPKDIWIRHSHGLLKGHYGELQRRALSSNRQLKKVLSFLNLYTVMVEFTTTEASIQKFRQVVETPGPDVSDYWIAQIQKEVKILASEYHFDTSDVSYAAHYEQVAVGKKHQEEDFTSTIERFFRTASGRRIIIDFPCVYQPLVNLLGFRGYRYIDAPEVMGRVFRIPSPGLKDRWVCDFNKALDHCLKPMGRRIYDTVATLPWDITFDEGKCLDKIQSRLKNGQVAYSFDLSSATDRFPWTLQHAALKAFSTGEKFQEMVSLYDTLIHMPALMPDGTQITWVQGQPLGAYPSFATFTFTHGVLLHMLLRATGRSYDGQFFVHGDDVVVLDDALAKLYKQMMVVLEVPLSPFKTLQSNKVAEINSKVITAEHVLTIPKWKPITRHNTLGQIKNWGLGVIKFLKLNKEESEAYIRLASLPVALGGAGVNPFGLPLEKRMEGLEDILFKDKELSYEGSSRSKVLRRYLGNPNFKNLLGNALRDAEAADQAALANTPFRVFGDYRDLDIMGSNTYSVNPDLHRAIDQGPQRQRERDEVRSNVAKLRRSCAFGSTEEDE